MIDISGPAPDKPRFGLSSVVRRASTTLFIALMIVLVTVSLLIISFLIIGVCVYNSLQIPLNNSDI